MDSQYDITHCDFTGTHSDFVTLNLLHCVFFSPYHVIRHHVIKFWTPGPEYLI